MCCKVVSDLGKNGCLILVVVEIIQSVMMGSTVGNFQVAGECLNIQRYYYTEIINHFLGYMHIWIG